MFLVGWMLACKHGETPDGGTSGDDIPDPYAALDVTACEGGGLVANTATAWYVGDLTIHGETFGGTETAAVHWSSAWLDTCGFDADCRVVWNLTGSVGDPGACSDCDYGLDVTATLDDDASTCPTTHRNDFGDSEWTSGYDVQLVDDGHTVLSYSETGTAIGGWYWSGDRVTYVFEHAVCNPYPDDLGGLCD